MYPVLFSFQSSHIEGRHFESLGSFSRESECAVESFLIFSLVFFCLFSFLSMVDGDVFCFSLIFFLPAGLRGFCHVFLLQRCSCHVVCGWCPVAVVKYAFGPFAAYHGILAQSETDKCVRVRLRQRAWDPCTRWRALVPLAVILLVA